MSASIKSVLNKHGIVVTTNDASKQISIPPKESGYGSSVNGGELLLLALATCFCNDLYREASKRNIAIAGVSVACTGEFGSEGEPGFNFRYTANVESDAPKAVIDELIRDTDQVAEIHNTLRKGINVTLEQ
ncbi:MAG TPA: OsmC family protein [Mucilaginibacter sp.]|nr:OsmC family protein [Mucilaginibacter sp.]